MGGAGDNTTGATWVFLRNSSDSWNQSGTKIVGTGYVRSPAQGNGVSLSGDGLTLAVGGPGDDSRIGATWMFNQNSNGTWSQKETKLVGPGYTGQSDQGSSVSLSADGSKLATGGPGDGSNLGAAWIFNNLGVALKQLVGSGYPFGSPYIYQGESVSLSADGLTLAMGGYANDNYIGATWIFQSSGGWHQEGPKLVGTGYAGSSQQGHAVSLSADGKTLAVGSPGDNNSIGAVWMFSQNSNNTWSQYGTKLVATDRVGQSNQGRSVSLSADGQTLAVGGPGDNVAIGSCWIWKNTGGIWSQVGTKLVGAGTIGQSHQDNSVSLSSDGLTLAVGGYGDSTNVGATWVFTAV